MEKLSATWIVVNIGCIECGVSSNIVGVFDDEARAEAIAEALNANKETNWREGGQNHYEVFPMPTFNEVAEEYRAALQSHKESKSNG